MIYLTVGTFPAGFDRLVKAVDELCYQYKVECVAQISGGKYKPKNMSYKEFYSSVEQNNYISSSQFVIAHGGFGVIGDVMRQKKPLLVFPRSPEEGPNDQRPVASRLASEYEFSLCSNMVELNNVFELMLNSSETNPRYHLGSNVPEIIFSYLKKI